MICFIEDNRGNNNDGRSVNNSYNYPDTVIAEGHAAIGWAISLSDSIPGEPEGYDIGKDMAGIA